MAMELATSRVGDVTVVAVSQLTIAYADLEKLQQELFAAIDGEASRLVLDLAGVASMDSFGVGVLMSAYRRMAKKGGTLKLAAVTPRVRSALAISKVDTVVEIHDTVEAACASFGARG